MTLGQQKREWRTSPGADRYRRGMYTFFWRATPHPALMVFDAPESTHTCTRRTRSNTPLQALTLLNDEGFVELAHGLAERVLREAPPQDTERLRLAFRLCLARSPAPAELERLARLLDQERSEIVAGNAAERDQLAYTAVARVLMNLDEFITRE
jgi:hypothetical protein